MTTPLAHNARYRPFLLNERLGMFTVRAKPFASRVLYPLVAAGLYPLQHFRALVVVSAIAYVAATLLMYWLLLSFCTPLIAAVGALLFGSAPVIRALSGAALTDMLALCLLVLVFAAMIRYLLYGSQVYLGLAIAAGIAMSVTRPLPYIPLGAALAVGMYAIAWRRDRVLTRRASLLVVAALIAWAAYAIAAAVTHTPSLSNHLQWLYVAAKTHWVYQSNRPLSSAEQHSFSAWYVHQVVYVSKGWVKTLFEDVYPIVAILACGCGLYLGRKSPQSWIFAGGVLACCLGIFANPIEPELRRLIEAPATIGVVGGIAMLLQAVRVPRVRLISKHA
jgi:4-amino-4-deoxy-L-arabinose transferase-like glycosyltransferase